MNAKAETHISLFQWVWRSYFKASLLPLLILEIALISVYFLSNQFSNRENVNTIYALAEHQLTHLAQREAVQIDHQLTDISNATRYLQDFSATVMSAKQTAASDNPARFRYSPDGAFYTFKDTGGSAVFYSGILPIGKAERDKALRSAALDPALIGIKKMFPLVAQSYLNSFDSLNRIYPYFEVISQYSSKMNIPSYNFYYEADSKHNPKRGTVWTDVYSDPAGQGWMTSCIAPVYNQQQTDFLEGVVGVDITIASIVDAVKKLDIPWHGYGMLISRSGTILAVPEFAETDWGINGLVNDGNAKAINKDTFRPEEFNIYLKPAVAEAIKNTAAGYKKVTLMNDSLLAWATIPSTDWKIIIVAPEKTVLNPANTLAKRLQNIAIMMIIGMFLFYSLFLLMLHKRAIKMSLSISEPLKKIDDVVSTIAAGLPMQTPLNFAVNELDSTAQGIFKMSQQLDAAKEARALAKQELQKKSDQLQAIFDVSQSGYILVNDDNAIVLCNHAINRLLGIGETETLRMSESAFLQRLSLQAKTPINLSPTNDAERIELVRPRPTTLLCGMQLIYKANNKVSGKVYFFHDITKNEEVDRIKNDFLAHVTHELRTPLSSIFGYSELLLSNLISPDMQPEIITHIHQQAEHLVNMINELLDLTKIAERSGSDFTIVPHSLSELLAAAVNNFPVPKLREAPYFVALENDVMVNVDALRLQQVLWNILDNAYKFSSNDTSVSIFTKYHAASQWLAIEIIDFGIGMKADEIAQAFDRFYRADKSGNTSGTGLGLSLARDIMTLMNGTIVIASTPQVGTQVSINLPAIPTAN